MVFGPVELAVIFAIIGLIWGVSQLPKLANSVGRAKGEVELGREQVEEGLRDIQSEFEDDR